MKEKGRNGRLKKRNWFIHLMKPELVCLLSSFGLNEMKVCIGSPGKLDCLCSKKQFSAGKGQVPNQLQGWACTEPSSPGTCNLDGVFIYIASEHWE